GRRPPLVPGRPSCARSRARIRQRLARVRQRTLRDHRRSGDGQVRGADRRREETRHRRGAVQPREVRPRLTTTEAHHLSRGFHFFLWTRMLSTAGNQMVLVALGWQMYDLTGSAWDLGLVGLFQFVPTLLFTIPAGHLADRVDRRLVLTLAIGVQLFAAALLAWGCAAGFVDRAV